MDIFDKAQDLIDKAQERVADATTLAAWKANKAVRAKAIQTRKEQVEEQIGATTMQLGNRVYQLWKNRGDRDDQELERLCRTLDDLLARYREVNAELSAVNRTAYDGVAIGPRGGGPPGTATVLPAHEEGAPPRSLPPSPPPPAPPAPAPPVVQQAAPPVAPPPAPAVAPPAAQHEPQREEPAVAPRPVARAKPCPSCGETVPPEAIYCPRCGYMAR